MHIPFAKVNTPHLKGITAVSFIRGLMQRETSEVDFCRLQRLIVLRARSYDGVDNISTDQRNYRHTYLTCRGVTKNATLFAKCHNAFISIRAPQKLLLPANIILYAVVSKNIERLLRHERQ